MDDSELNFKSNKHSVDDNNNLVTSKSFETGLNTKGILRTGSPNRSGNMKRKVFISPLFEVIPDAWDAKSIPSIPCGSPIRKSASPLSLFYRLSPSTHHNQSSNRNQSNKTTSYNKNGGGGFLNRLYGANSLESVLLRNTEHGGDNIISTDTGRRKVTFETLLTESSTSQSGQHQQQQTNHQQQAQQKHQIQLKTAVATATSCSKSAVAAVSTHRTHFRSTVCKPRLSSNNSSVNKVKTHVNMEPVQETISRDVANRVDAKPYKVQPKEKQSQNRIVIRNGKVVNCDSMFDADVFIEDGIIRQIGPNLIVPGGCRVIDAKGHYVIPGGIDPHVHLEGVFMGAQSMDDYYAGTKAALAGGTTTLFDTPIDASLTPIQLYEKYRALADAKVCCDYGLHLPVTAWRDGSTEKELETLVKQKGINSFKAFMAYKDSLMLEDAELIKLFDCCKRLGAVPKVHAENGHLIDFLAKKLLRMGVTGPEGHLQSRPEDLEAEAVHRATVLAHHVQAPLYIVHVMSKSAAEEVNRARARGALVIGETLASTIGTDGIHYYNRCWRHAAGHVMSPPLRPDRTTPEGLVNALSAGVLDVVASDHIVFSAQQKAMGQTNFTKIPNGVNGVEERLMVIWEKGVRTGKMDPTRFVAVTSANAAKIFNIYPRKGKIAVGSDADVVVWGKKPKTIKAETHHSRVDFNIFEGLQVEFSPIAVISRGVVVLDEAGLLHVSQGKGRFIECPPFPAILYERIRNRERNMGPVKIDRSERPETLARPAGQSNGTPPITTNGTKTNLITAAGVTTTKDNQAAIAEPLMVSTKSGNFEAIPTSGPPSPALSTASSGTSTSRGFHLAKTRSGVRNLQDSSFKLTGEQFDDDKLGRTGIKVHNPPGGRSSGIF